MRERSLVRQESTNAAAPGPRTVAVPRWETSNNPTASRTAACSASTPPPAYSIGIDQPLKSASLAPSPTWRSCNGEVRRLTRCTLAGGAGPASAADDDAYDPGRAADHHRDRPPPREAQRRRRRRRDRQGS